NVGPLVYDGPALDGGHSFVCDGYDGNGYFHFNWGWGGMSDGYYLLDALNPDEFGIGGAAGGYNLGQQVILNISPKKIETGVPQLMQFGNVTGKVSGNILSLSLEDAADPGFQYINPAPVTLTFGLKVENVNDASKEPQYYSSSKKDLEAKQGSYFKWEETGTTLDLEKTGMTEGQQYNIIISTDITQGDATSWSEVQAMPGKANYVTVIKKSDGYEVINHTPGNLTVSDFQILSSPIYYDKPVKFSAGFTNSSTQQLTRNYSAVFFNSEGEECYKMENYSINVDGNQSTTDTWTSVNWYKEKGATEIKEATDFKVKLYDNWQGSYVEGIEETVTVMPTTPDAKVESEFEITNGTKEGDVYIVEGNQLDVSLTVKVLDGFFNHTMMLAIQAPLNDKDYFTIMHKHFDAIPDLSAGEEQVFDMSVIFEQAEPDKVYRVEVWGQGSGFNESRLVKFNLPTSGINHISPDSEGNFKIFNLDGTLRSITSDPTVIKSLPRGIYIINGRKIAI
ncbi:MAG: C10 family peptidase, partial [Muribaculaceae bacterium]|nr:C10 family peptidase [Muribaculaceae bacterium]